MLEKYTFDNDAETNAFFKRNPDAYLVKFIVAGGQQHIIITRDKKFKGKEHLPVSRNGSGQHGVKITQTQR